MYFLCMLVIISAVPLETLSVFGKMPGKYLFTLALIHFSWLFAYARKSPMQEKFIFQVL